MYLTLNIAEQTALARGRRLYPETPQLTCAPSPIAWWRDAPRPPRSIEEQLRALEEPIAFEEQLRSLEEQIAMYRSVNRALRRRLMMTAAFTRGIHG